MAQLLIRNLDNETVEYYKQMAKQHHRSLQGELKAILENLAKSFKEKKSNKQAPDWPKDFFSNIMGQWQGEPLTRAFEGDYDKRGDFK